jgi:osmotically-inducible protein OsmY
VRVSIWRDRVSLRGAVASVEAREVVEEIAAGLAGEENVDSHLHVGR